jgi:hypothetical protein
MPRFHRAIRYVGPRYDDEAFQKEASREVRRSRKTRFLADENIEPWVLLILRYRRQFDVLDCGDARIRGHDDLAVFSASWRLQRVLITHDADFLDDTRFPFHRCAGLVVFPTFPSQAWNYGILLQRTLNLIRKGERLWLNTKMIAGRDFKVIVRTWNKDAGLIRTFTVDVGQRIPLAEYPRGETLL